MTGTRAGKMQWPGAVGAAPAVASPSVPTYISSSNEWDAIPLHGFACGGMQTWPSWEDTVLTFVQRAHVSAALTAAREARFEHGEAPRITSPRITPPRLDPPRLG